jgi:hypothetical protein
VVVGGGGGLMGVCLRVSLRGGLIVYEDLCVLREFPIDLRVECRFVRGFIELDRFDIKFMGFV